MKTQKPEELVISSRKMGCRTSSMKALTAMDAKDRMLDALWTQEITEGGWALKVKSGNPELQTDCN